METREILTRFKNGELSIEEAEHYFRKEPFEEMDEYAKLDSHREIRSGFPEVIFCRGKADQHFVQIFRKLYEDNGEVLGTRASRHQYELVKDMLPGVEYDELSHIIKIEKKEKEHKGKGKYEWKYSRYSCGRGSSSDSRIFWFACRTDL